MPEPLDPAAAGVASLLKSLRTRAGLREDRLAATELALDSLTGLDRVAELIDAGDTTQRAIVRAVRAAAGALEPTMSIVADACLCLKLSADVTPDPDLYARDLGRRRDALLANWNRLHELRSVSPPGPAPTLRTLRLEVETVALGALGAALAETTLPPLSGGPSPGTVGPAALPEKDLASLRSADLRVFGADLATSLRSRGLTSQDAAGALGLTRSELTRWEDGKDLPSEAKAKALDDYLSARGAIYTLAAKLRSKPVRPARRPARPRHTGTRAPTLRQVFQNVAGALRDCLTRDADGTPQGWPHDLRQLSRPATALGTAYGIKTMLQLEGFLDPGLMPVAEHLSDMAFPGGGYAARAQSGPRPEGTAAVLDTLHRIDGTAHFDAQLAGIERGLGDLEKSRPFILTTVLEASVKLRPDAQLTASLADNLLAARRPYGDLLLWPEKAEPMLVSPAASAAHTARAVAALAQVQAVRPSAQVQEALNEAATWLVEQPDLANAHEEIDRAVDGGVEQQSIRHFTAAWVVKALVSLGLPASHPAVSGAVAGVWRSYNDTAALWRWDNGDLPIWMTFDAVDALRLAALAATIRPGRFPVQ